MHNVRALVSFRNGRVWVYFSACNVMSRSLWKHFSLDTQKVESIGWISRGVSAQERASWDVSVDVWFSYGTSLHCFLKPSEPFLPNGWKRFLITRAESPLKTGWLLRASLLARQTSYSRSKFWHGQKAWRCKIVTVRRVRYMQKEVFGDENSLTFEKWTQQLSKWR
jgi:hypothetical protein